MTQYSSYRSAKKLILSLPIKSKKDWEKMKIGEHPKIDQFPPTLPRTPEEHYKENGWKSWSDFLGLNLRKKKE